jgi:hypothetical protein
MYKIARHIRLDAPVSGAIRFISGLHVTLGREAIDMGDDHTHWQIYRPALWRV